MTCENSSITPPVSHVARCASSGKQGEDGSKVVEAPARTIGVEQTAESQGVAASHARDTILALLAARAPGATICPSEVARGMVAAKGTQTGPQDWRNAMPLVHAAVDQLLAEGFVRLSWKGELLATRAGPYRIGRVVPPD